MNYGESYSLSDIAAATGNGGNNGNNSGFGNGEGSWWIIVFLIFAFLGWGRGFGGNDGNGSNGSGSVMDAYVLNSDFATLQRLMESGFDRVSTGINQVNQGICNLGYSTLENFNTTNMGVATGFANLNNALCNQSFQIERGIAGVGTQIQNCCCDLRQQIADTSCGIQRSLDGVNYNMAMNTNNIQSSMCNNTRDIIESQNCGTRAILDALNSYKLEEKNAQITALQNQLNNAELRASQEAQTNYLYTAITDKLSPCPKPSYLTCNPNGPLNYSVTGNCGCNSGCGC